MKLHVTRKADNIYHVCNVEGSKIMGAGLSKQQINRRIRYHLQLIAHRLELAGVPTIYSNYQVCPDLTGVTSAADICLA